MTAAVAAACASPRDGRDPAPTRAAFAIQAATIMALRISTMPRTIGAKPRRRRRTPGRYSARRRGREDQPEGKVSCALSEPSSARARKRKPRSRFGRGKQKLRSPSSNYRPVDGAVKPASSDSRNIRSRLRFNGRRCAAAAAAPGHDRSTDARLPEEPRAPGRPFRRRRTPARRSRPRIPGTTSTRPASGRASPSEDRVHQQFIANMNLAAIKTVHPETLRSEVRRVLEELCNDSIILLNLAVPRAAGHGGHGMKPSAWGCLAAAGRPDDQRHSHQRKQRRLRRAQGWRRRPTSPSTMSGIWSRPSSASWAAWAGALTKPAPWWTADCPTAAASTPSSRPWPWMPPGVHPRFGVALSGRRPRSPGAMTQEMKRFLAACVEARLNVLISGGTGSGKTTLLNALSAYIPPEERVITIEDAAELRLQQPHVGRLETRPNNAEGAGEVTTRDLVETPSHEARPHRRRRVPRRRNARHAPGHEHRPRRQPDHGSCQRHARALGRLEVMVGMTGLEIPIWVIRRQIASAIHLVIQVSRLQGGARRWSR